jgi:hypothetical protein
VVGEAIGTGGEASPAGVKEATPGPCRAELGGSFDRVTWRPYTALANIEETREAPSRMAGNLWPRAVRKMNSQTPQRSARTWHQPTEWWLQQQEQQQERQQVEHRISRSTGSEDPPAR